jgi:dihydropteroate synthase
MSSGSARRERPRYALHASDRVLELGSRPWLMGIVNASPDSFSDGARYRTLEAQHELARELLAAGADIIDIGGESASTDNPPADADEELARVVPLVERIAGELGATVSIDTYKPEVALAAVAAGARLINDVSGLRDPALAEVCAATGAALVLMHTRAAPRQRLQDPALYGDITSEVLAFLRERLAGTLAALAHGVDAGAQIFRLHDVAAATDFLTVRAALSGELQVDSDLTLGERLRHDREPAS